MDNIPKFRMNNGDGSVSEVALTAEQAEAIASGDAISYFPRDEQVLVDEHGTIIWSESARPEAA